MCVPREGFRFERNVDQSKCWPRHDLVMASDHLQHQVYEQVCAHQCPAYSTFRRSVHASRQHQHWKLGAASPFSAFQRLRAAVLVRTTFWAHSHTLIHFHLPIAQWPKQARAGQNRFSLELASPITPSIMHYTSPDRSQDQAIQSASLCGFTQLSYPPIHKCCRSSLFSPAGPDSRPALIVTEFPSFWMFLIGFCVWRIRFRVT